LVFERLLAHKTQHMNADIVTGTTLSGNSVIVMPGGGLREIRG